MTYKKIYMTFNIKRHMHARVIFRCGVAARPTRWQWLLQQSASVYRRLVWTSSKPVDVFFDFRMFMNVLAFNHMHGQGNRGKKTNTSSTYCEGSAGRGEKWFAEHGCSFVLTLCHFNLFFFNLRVFIKVFSKTRAKNGENAFLLRVASVAKCKCDL